MLISFASAQSSMIIHHKSQGIKEISFVDRPVMSFVNDSVFFGMNESVFLSPISELANITFNRSSTKLEMKCSDSLLDQVCIYNINGMLVGFTSKGDCSLNTLIENLPLGVYIVKFGNEAFRIVKK